MHDVDSTLGSIQNKIADMGEGAESKIALAFKVPLEDLDKLITRIKPNVDSYFTDLAAAMDKAGKKRHEIGYNIVTADIHQKPSAHPCWPLAAIMTLTRARRPWWRRLAG